MLGSGRSTGTIGLRKVPSPRSALRWPSTPRAQLEACGAAQSGVAACPNDAPPASAPPPNNVPRVKRRVKLTLSPAIQEDKMATARISMARRLVAVPDPREEFAAGIMQ